MTDKKKERQIVISQIVDEAISTNPPTVGDPENCVRRQAGSSLRESLSAKLGPMAPCVNICDWCARQGQCQKEIIAKGGNGDLIDNPLVVAQKRVLEMYDIDHSNARHMDNVGNH